MVGLGTVVAGLFAKGRGNMLHQDTRVSGVYNSKGGRSIGTYAGVACEGLLPVGGCIQASATGEGRVDAFAWRFVQSSIDDARDVGALCLVQHGIVNRDVTQD